MSQVSSAPAYQPLPATSNEGGTTTSTTSSTTGSGVLGTYTTVPPVEASHTDPVPHDEGPVPDAPLSTSLPRASYGAIAAAVMQQMASDQLLDSLLDSLETQQKLTDGLTDESVKKIEEMCKKAESAERARKAGNALAWVKAIGGLVLGVAAFVGTCVLAAKTGGAAWALVPGAFMGLQAGVAGVMTLADPDLKGYYVGEISSSTMAIAEASGASPEDAAKIAIAMTVLVTVIIVACTLKADPTKMSEMAKLAAKAMQITNMAFSGTMDMAQGANQLEANEIEFAKAKIQIESKKLEGAMARVQELIEMYTSLFAAVTKANQERNDTLSDTLQNDAASMKAAVANFS